MLGCFLLNSALILSPDFETSTEYLPRPIVPNKIRYFGKGCETKTAEDWGKANLCDFENKNWQSIFESIIEIVDEVEAETTLQSTMQDCFENPNEYTVCILQPFRVLNNFLNTCLEDFYKLNPDNKAMISELILGKLEPATSENLDKYKDLSILCIFDNTEPQNFRQMDPKIQWGFVSQIFKKLKNVRNL